MQPGWQMIADCDITIGHPGWLDDFILRNSSFTINRTREAAVLSSPELTAWLDAQDLELLDYHQL